MFSLCDLSLCAESFAGHKERHSVRDWKRLLEALRSNALRCWAPVLEMLVLIGKSLEQSLLPLLHPRAGRFILFLPVPGEIKRLWSNHAFHHQVLCLLFRLIFGCYGISTMRRLLVRASYVCTWASHCSIRSASRCYRCDPIAHTAKTCCSNLLLRPTARSHCSQVSCQSYCSILLPDPTTQSYCSHQTLCNKVNKVPLVPPFSPQYPEELT